MLLLLLLLFVYDFDTFNFICITNVVRCLIFLATVVNKLIEHLCLHRVFHAIITLFLKMYAFISV